MRLSWLKLKNFMSYRDCELDLSEITACSILGSNGSGKSSLAEAIVWALFGYARLPSRELIHTGEKRMIVELKFTIDDREYALKREYNDGSVTLELREDDQLMASGTLNTSAVLSRTIGASRELISQSIIVNQGQLSSFVTATPTQRRDLIISILGLDKYSAAWEVAKASYKTMNDVVMTYNQTVNAIQRELNNMADMDTIDQSIVRLNGDITLVTERMSELIIKKEQFLAQSESVSDQAKIYNEQIDSLRKQATEAVVDLDASIKKVQGTLDVSDKQIADLPSLQVVIEDLNRELNDVNAALERIKDLRNKVNKCNEEIQSRKDKLTIMVSARGICPLCGTDIGTDRWGQMTSAIEGEVSAFLADLNQHTDELNKLPVLRPAQAVMNELDDRKTRLVQLEMMQQARPVLVVQLEELNKKRDGVMTQFEQQCNQLETKVSQLRSTTDVEVDAIEHELTELRQKHKGLSDSLIQWGATKQSRESQERMINDTLNLLKLAQTRLPETEFVVNALSPSGIPLMLIDHYMPIIEEKARDLLHVMSDNQMDLKMDIVEDKVKKGVDLHAGVEQIRPIRSLSGGEQTRVSLALRIALSQVLHEMTGCKYDCLLIDEPEYLDDQGIVQFISAISSLKNIFPQIFVMSHLETVKNAFSQHILVQKVNGTSVASVIV